MDISSASTSDAPASALEIRGGELLFMQIANFYRCEIQRGAFSVGMKLPTCSEVGRAYGVAAQTVNRAFDILVKDGLVTRRRGMGTVVASRESLLESAEGKRPSRQLVLPVCHVARMSEVAQEEANLIMDYINGFTEGFDAWKCRFEIAHLRGDQPDLDMVQSLFEYRQTKGLVVMDLAEDATEYLIDKKFPVVFINRDETRRGVTSVVADHVLGYRDAWSYVNALGHRLSAFFGFDSKAFQTRYSECCSGRELAQVACVMAGPEPIRVSSHASDEEIWVELIRVYGAWKRGCCKRIWPTVFFAQTDIIAARLMRVLRNYGIDVPSDVSVIGFNDDALACHLNPALTTLAKPRFKMALAASRLLLDILDRRPAAQGALQTFPVHLVQRESCASPS